MPSTSLVLDRYVVAAAVVLTCVLFTSRAADPVNVIKLTALMLCALTLIGTAAYSGVRHRVLQVPAGPAAWAAGALLLGLLVSTVTAPVTSTAVFGAYGRNSGLLAYASALVLFLTALRTLAPPRTRVLMGAVVLAGMFSATYGLLQRAGIDAVPWNNPFNPIIAALGNPNFASGYLGIAASVAAGGALWRGWQTAWRAASALTTLLCLVAAGLSDSVQGPIAAAGGLVVVAMGIALNLERRLRRLALGGLALAVSLGASALLLGALRGQGPAGPIFSDIGSRARAHYWQAALEMFQAKPLVGVGLDHYGSFWRSSRSPASVELLGGPSYSDSAHSVPLQILAQGGVVLGVAYAAFAAVTLVALVRGLLRLSGADRTLLAAMGAGWVAYQVQSSVSIDQIPLMILHFTLAGAVIAASGTARSRQVRLPGAVRAMTAHPNDSRTRRRTSSASVVRRREPTALDLALLSAVAILITFSTWQAFDPLRANIAIATGDRLLAKGEGNLALVAYERATRLAPGQPVYWMKQGALYRQVQQPALARGAYEEAVKRDPYDVNALLEAGALAEAAGDLAGARERFQRAVELDPLNPGSLTAAATFGLRHAGAVYARDLLEESVLRLPKEATLWTTLGDARAVLDDPELAREAYRRALRLEPSQEAARAGLDKLAAATS